MRGCARRSASGRLNSPGSGPSRGWPSPVYVTLETARRGGGRCWGDEKVANRILARSFSPQTRSYIPLVIRALEELGAVVDLIHPAAAVTDLSNVRVEHDLYVLKQQSGLALSLAGVLHAQGAAIVNPYPVSLALRDKIVMSRVLQAAGVSTPATYVTTHPDKLAPLLEAGPLIVKPYQGPGGYGIRIIRSAAELADVPASKDPVLAQRYHAPQGPDRKMLSIGGRIFGVKKVFPRRTEAEKHGEPFTPTPELCEIARRCGQAS